MMRRIRSGGSSDPYYDIVEDYDLIVASFSAQYGIRMYTKEFKEMKWVEFRALLAGLGADTPLGQIISIRSEEDKDVLKQFTDRQREIRNRWRNRKAKEVSKENLESVLDDLKNTFIRMAGGLPDKAGEV